MEYQSSIVAIILAPFFIFGGVLLYKKLVRRARWKESMQTPFPTQWENLLREKFHPYKTLNESEKQILHHKIQFFLLDKNIEGVGDFQVTEEMKLLIAAQACLIILNLQTGVFKGLKNIYVLEDAFIQNENPINPSTGQPFYVPRLGEAWKQGPIVLSWKAVLEGLQSTTSKSNVVYHEFTHNLDQQDGHFDGTPKLGSERSYERWAQVMGEEFMQLRSDVGHHHRSDIDPYGATNEAEFFAVCSEYFFSQPLILQRHHPAVFDLYLNYFKIDPRRWN
jgi:Mlc titration factor MtfA (ptsG expression regulator)